MAKTGSKRIDTTYTEAQLIELAQKGEGQTKETAFWMLYERYRHIVMSELSKSSNMPQEEKEDVCMESFTKAFRQIDSYNGNFKFSTWITTIARNTAKDHVSKAKVRNKDMEETLDENSVDESLNRDMGESPENEFISQESYEKILQCIESLPEIYREAARLRFVSDMEYNQIAENLSLPLNTVKTRINRARRLILDKINEE